MERKKDKSYYLNIVAERVNELSFKDPRRYRASGSDVTLVPELLTPSQLDEFEKSVENSGLSQQELMAALAGIKAKEEKS